MLVELTLKVPTFDEFVDDILPEALAGYDGSEGYCYCDPHCSFILSSSQIETYLNATNKSKVMPSLYHNCFELAMTTFVHIAMSEVSGQCIGDSLERRGLCKV